MSEPRANHDTRERILDVAERLFMENGYEATSMRLITGAAEVNLAAVNYHFGSKEALLREVFRRRLTWLNDQRLQALDRLEAQAAGAPLKPSQILEAFFGTLLRMGEDEALGGMTFLRLLGRTLTDPAEFIRTFFAGEYAQVIDRYKRALFHALPDVPKAEIVWRLHFMLGAMSYAIAGTDVLEVVTGCGLDDLAGETVSPEDGATVHARRLAQRLMPFLLGGLRAPLPQFGDLPIRQEESPQEVADEGRGSMPHNRP
ncbi:MAG TPA: TetR/AcrR family transcriptional regulator [Accumulibacter sp.]|uniref:TetR/AcrR family transcriptional regulator n=1 Tax=Accumulibacter sp. TaxID=2053492 RepID=UPI00287A5235|nr:TetR/AcrR family transcriptional regulator [Accumulibacter sp.]MDS4053676.1 TetR/AcrR family transcriptional regulator [Accumulibacter sp.]HMV06775.1 TetR/AcrR family transcriptional regulator [Accumulibacter sp.]HMW80922.1 TetR/AcrR family transcriptional regulator [Accumulibacter sp.]HNB68986.1 TetR/AcrR family transcriptional regulator [Accumulibacter sp.]HND39423.1 TetR/AcrR family transcriptional regulator [Accumulibacter sp.]